MHVTLLFVIACISQLKSTKLNLPSSSHSISLELNIGKTVFSPSHVLQNNKINNKIILLLSYKCTRRVAVMMSEAHFELRLFSPGHGFLNNEFWHVETLIFQEILICYNFVLACSNPLSTMDLMNK